MSVCVSMCIHVQCTYIARLLSLTVCVCMRDMFVYKCVHVLVCTCVLVYLYISLLFSPPQPFPVLITRRLSTETPAYDAFSRFSISAVFLTSCY